MELDFPTADQLRESRKSHLAQNQNEHFKTKLKADLERNKVFEMIDDVNTNMDNDREGGSVSFRIDSYQSEYHQFIKSTFENLGYVVSFNKQEGYIHAGISDYYNFTIKW